MEYTMWKRGEYLLGVLLLFAALAASGAMGHHKKQQELDRGSRTDQRPDSDFVPIIHISSAVLQLVPDEQGHLLLPSKATPSAVHPPWPLVYRLDEQVSAEPRHKVSDNLDFEPQHVVSHG